MTTVEELEKRIAELTEENNSLKKEQRRLNRSLLRVSAAFSDNVAEREYLSDALEEQQEISLLKVEIDKPWVYCYFSDGTRLAQEMTEDVEDGQITASVYMNILKKLVGVEPVQTLRDALVHSYAMQPGNSKLVVLTSKKGEEQCKQKKEAEALFTAMGYCKTPMREA